MSEKPTHTIKAKYLNGVFKPLNLRHYIPEGQEVTISLPTPSTDVKTLSDEHKMCRIEQLCGSSTLWGTTAEEVDDYIRSLRLEWE